MTAWCRLKRKKRPTQCKGIGLCPLSFCNKFLLKMWKEQLAVTIKQQDKQLCYRTFKNFE